MKVMLDTSTCIYAMNRRRGFNTRLPLEDCGVSIIVLGELEFGAQRSNRSAQSFASIHEFAAAVQVVDLGTEVARLYGRLRAHLHRIGRPIGPNDLWIAAHSLARDVPLITHNLSEFRRVPDLSVETWMTA